MCNQGSDDHKTIETWSRRDFAVVWWVFRLWYVYMVTDGGEEDKLCGLGVHTQYLFLFFLYISGIHSGVIFELAVSKAVESRSFPLDSKVCGVSCIVVVYVRRCL